MQLLQFDGGDRRECFDDVKILFNQRRARQPEIRLYFEQFLEAGISAQEPAPYCRREVDARNAPSPARPD
jgi:hypothetical protein